MEKRKENNTIQNSSNIIQNSEIRVGGDFSLVNICFGGDSITALTELVDIIEKIREEIITFSIQAETQEELRKEDNQHKKRKHIEWEVKNYLIPKINLIKSENMEPPPYIWSNSLNHNKRFWTINLSGQETNNNSLARLEDFLKKSNFKDADIETANILTKEINSKKIQQRDWISYKDLELIPIELLYEIDQLWLQYTKGLFGITPQYEIWKDVKGDFKMFGQKTGWWQKGTDWIDHFRKLQFDLNANKGHLPSLLSSINTSSGMINNWKRLYENLILKIDNFFNQTIN